MSDRPLPWYRRLFGAKAETGVTWVGPVSNIQLLGAGIARPDAEKLTRAIVFATSAYCYTAMLWRASRVGEAPLAVYREGPDGEEWLPEHPASAFLAEPRLDVGMGELLAKSQMYRDLFGACVWVLDRRADGRVAQAVPFSGEDVKTYADPRTGAIFGRYEVRVGGGTWIAKRPEDVVHFRDVDPLSWRTPVSKVDAALTTLDLGHHTTRIVRSLLQKAVFPGGVISADPTWKPTDAEFRLWIEQMKAWHTGPAKTGEPLFTNGGTTYTPVSRNMADLIPDEVLDRVEATVGAVFGTPPVVLGWLSGMKNSPWSQMSEARRQAYEDTIEPIWRDVETRLSRALLSPEERARGYLVRFDTSKVKALAEDEERKVRIAASASSFWTVNEARVYTGQEPLDDGDPRGEEIPGLVSLAIADSIGGGDGGGSSAPPPDDEGGATVPADDGGKGLAWRNDTKDLLWLLFDLETKVDEPAWERRVFAYLQDEKAEVLRLARSTLKAEKADPGPLDPTSAARFRKLVAEAIVANEGKLRTTVYPLVLSTGTKGVRRLGTRLSLGFDVLQPGLLDYAAEEADFLVRAMGKTTGEAVAGAVQAGLAAGESVAALTKRLSDLPAFDRARAKLVARTETTRSWNGAQRRSLSRYSKENGRKAVKSWLSSRDDRVREEHIDLDDGKEIGIDETFRNGLREPGEPNCRCTLVYGFADSGNA